MKNSQVAVRGAFEAQKLAEYVYKRMGKQATIIKVEGEKKKEEEEKKPKEEEKKPEEPQKEAKKEEEEGGKDKKEGKEAGEPPVKVEAVAEESRLEVKKNEVENYDHHLHYYYQQDYPQRFVEEYQHELYPSPQMFSDENPNECCVV